MKSATPHRLLRTLLAGAAGFLPSLAMAHPGHGGSDGTEPAVSKLLHQFLTLDHLVPALAAGCLAFALAKLLISRRRS